MVFDNNSSYSPSFVGAACPDCYLLFTQRGSITVGLTRWMEN